MYWITFHILFIFNFYFYLPVESLSCRRKAINNKEREQDHAGAAPSAFPRSGGPTAGGLGVPAAHGGLAMGLRAEGIRAAPTHPLRAPGQGDGAHGVLLCRTVLGSDKE